MQVQDWGVIKVHETFEKVPYVIIANVEETDPEKNMVKVKFQYPLNVLASQWARMCQFNAGSSILSTSQINISEKDTRISNIKRTGFYVLPNVGDFVICAYINGVPFEGNLICFGSIITNTDVKSDQGRRFDDWLMHHRSDSFFRMRCLDSSQKLTAHDSNNKSGNISFSVEDSRSELELNNKDGSIFRITQFKEGYNQSDDEISTQSQSGSASKIPALMFGRYPKDVDVNSEKKNELITDRGMIQMLHNTGAKLEFRNIEKKSSEDKKLKFLISHKNNYFTISEDTLDKPTITINQSTSSYMNFDEDGNISIDASKSDKKITINAEGSTVTIENGKVTIKSDQVIVDSADIQLGKGATEHLVKGDAFKVLWDSHVHPTGVGPSGAPTLQMGSAHLSSISKTK
jgi:hypothetical protein